MRILGLGSSGIGRRAFRVILASSLALSLLGALGFYAMEYRARTEALSIALKRSVEAQVPAISKALWNLDQGQVAILLEGLLKQPYLSYASVEEGLGGSWTVGTLRAGSPVTKTALVYGPGGPLLGYLTIQTDSRQMIRDILEVIAKALGFWGLILLIENLLVFFLFRSLVTIHLMKAAAHFRSLDGQGDWRPLSLDKRNRGDELDLLAEAFNEMGSRLTETAARKESALAELRESEERYRSLVEHAPDAILIYDPQAGHFTDCNARSENFFGLSRARILELDPEGLYRAEGVTDAALLAEVRESVARSDRGEDLLLRRSLPRPGRETLECEVRVTRIEFRGRSLSRSSYLDITDRIRAEEALKRSLREKEVLLQEVYHRTKNNMQVIAALLDMKAETSCLDESRALLKEMVGRINSMALVHEKLYRSKDLSRIDLGEYAGDLVASISRGLLHEGPCPSIALDTKPGLVALLDIAIPFGLVVNELLTNALKHGYPEGRGGQVTVSLREKGEGWLEVVVADDGVGLPPGFDIRADGGMGLQTVLSLVEAQLHGHVRVESSQGLRWILDFRKDLYEARV